MRQLLSQPPLTPDPETELNYLGRLPFKSLQNYGLTQRNTNVKVAHKDHNSNNKQTGKINRNIY